MRSCMYKSSSFLLNLRYENNLLKQNKAFRASNVPERLDFAIDILFTNQIEFLSAFHIISVKFMPSRSSQVLRNLDGINFQR